MITWKGKSVKEIIVINTYPLLFFAGAAHSSRGGLGRVWRAGGRDPGGGTAWRGGLAAEGPARVHRLRCRGRLLSACLHARHREPLRIPLHCCQQHWRRGRGQGKQGDDVYRLAVVPLHRVPLLIGRDSSRAGAALAVSGKQGDDVYRLAVFPLHRVSLLIGRDSSRAGAALAVSGKQGDDVYRLAVFSLHRVSLLIGRVRGRAAAAARRRCCGSRESGKQIVTVYSA